MQGNEKLCSSDGTSKEEWPTLIHTVAAPKDRLASAKVTVVDAGKTCLVVAGVASGVAVGIVSFKRMKVSFDAYDAAAKPPFPRAPF